MNLVDEVHERIRHLPTQKVLRGMGYLEPGPKTIGHFEYLRESPYLGLDRLLRDRMNTERSLIFSLCIHLGLNIADCRPIVDALTEQLHEDRAAFHHWVFVDTDYVLGGTRIFILALFEGLRRLLLPRDFWRHPWEEKLARVGQFVRDHMEESGGELDIWGEIKRYEFIYEKTSSITFSPYGEVIGSKENYVPPEATVRLKSGKALR